jgi:hypothetical protein
MSIYDQWGLSDNPFQTTALPPTKHGSNLLIGREVDLKKLKARLNNPPKLPTLEGLNGVGKSSLVNVAAYECYQSFLADPDQPLLIPCRKIFQLRTDQDLDDFIDDVLREVAQSLIDHDEQVRDFATKGLHQSASLNKWLNLTQVKSFQGGAGGLSVGLGAALNTGDGFSRSGFRKAVTTWLEELFPTARDGGVVCTIDNLELLQTSDAARRQLEAIRDELLTLPGLRWVLCGALGIVLGVASSPRLEGLLHTPLELGGVDDSFLEDIYNSRQMSFSCSETPYLPITVKDFRRLYDILARNLRSLFAKADDYCQWVAERDKPAAEDEKTKVFDEWLTQLSDKALRASQTQLTPRAWEVFNLAITLGTFSPSDFAKFGFNSIPAFRPYVRDLEGAALLVSTQDDSDKRRKTIQVTPQGWFVGYALKQSSGGES